jgi:uncharacterized membrane protein YgdD (TMEM256/DUF423 family)
MGAFIWYAFLTRPPAPWVGVIAATLGISGFLLPWDLSMTPGITRIVSAINCLTSAGWDTSRCLPSASYPPGTPLAISEGTLTQRAIVNYLAFYLFQALMLVVVLVLALVVARWRTWRWLFALTVVSYSAALMGNPNLLIKGSAQFGAVAPLGSSLVNLGFGMLFLCAGAAKWNIIDNIRLAQEKTRQSDKVHATVYNNRHEG